MAIGRFSSGMAAAMLVASSLAALAQGATTRTTGLVIQGDQPIQIESDRLEVREQENLAIFSGNVNVVQGDTLLKAGRMTVHYAQAGNDRPSAGTAGIERIEADGKVYVRSKEQEATGDRGTFDMETEVLVMTGKEVVLSEGPNVIVGCKLTVQMKTGAAKLDGCAQPGSGQGGGRIKALLQPGSQSR